MNTKSYITERYEQLKGEQRSPGLDTIRESGFTAFNHMGIPTASMRNGNTPGSVRCSTRNSFSAMRFLMEFPPLNLNRFDWLVPMMRMNWFL
jgi:hypothetical protein